MSSDFSPWLFLLVSMMVLATVSIWVIACACGKKKDGSKEGHEPPKEAEPMPPTLAPVDPPCPPEEPDPIMRCIYNFALEFYRSACSQRDQKRMSENESLCGTKVVSPLALQSAFFAAYLGSSTSSKQEMRRAIYPEIASVDEKEIEGIIRRVAARLDSTISVNDQQQDDSVSAFDGFSMAMRIYAPSNTYRYSAQFYDAVSSSGSNACDFFEYRFDTGGDRAPIPTAVFARSINRFVETASEGEMKEAIREGALKAALNPPVPSSPTARPAGLIVLAQMRIKCRWTIAFPPRDNSAMDFTVPGGYKMPMEVMSVRSSTFGLYQDAKCQMVRLPLADCEARAHLYIILPSKRGDVLALEASLTGDRLWTMLRQCVETDVKVTIPKMFVDSKLPPIKAAESLQALGMRGVFDPYQADFSPMIEAKTRTGLHVAAVIHDAVFEAYEEGGYAQCERFGSAKPKHFKADHPFVFVVASGRNQQVPLMIGRFGGRPYYKALQEKDKK